ncbi:S9 family peptidase [Parahaliea mediterranea]|uniref:S9 family peptidase n=1 Tax=Parahaliea mediterranea TaxID=651086 RepID=UPI001F4E8A51|nr:S9 family peptidase [Parahaliea mediterranea]
MNRQQPMNCWQVLAAMASAALCAGSALAAPVFAPEDVFQLRYASHPLVDSEGERALYLRHSMDIMKDRSRSNLWLVDIDSGREQPLTSGPNNISGAVLSPDDSRVAYISKDDVGSQIFVSWLDSPRSAQLTRLPEKAKNLAFSPDGKWLAFAMRVPRDAPVMGKLPAKPEGAEWAAPPVVVERSVYRNDGSGDKPEGYTHVFVMPADGGSPRQLTQGDFHHDGSIGWSGDGRALYVSANRNADWATDVSNTDIYRIDVASGELTALTERKGPDGDLAVSPDGKRIAWTGWDDRRMGYHRNRLYVMNRDGSDKRELLADLDRNIVDPQWSADGRAIYFQYDDKGATVLAATNLSGKLTELARDLGGTALGRPYTGAGFAVGGDGVYAYTVGSPAFPAELAVGESGRNRQLTRLNDNLLKYRDLAPVQELWVKSSFDQRDIQAWVALPPGFDPAKRYPLILEIHGGPFATYGPHFAAEIQLYAAAGYVVVYANPRGSTSYGEEFGNLIHHNYPSQDYDDLMSVVDAVIAKGYVDPQQLYVTGGSGGGVLTAWIVGSTDRFRAAVVAKPVINWTSFVLTADMSPYFARYWFDKMPWEDPETYWQRSPLSRVGNVTTPTMLLTGESDLRTPMPETEQYYQALKLRGVDTAMVRMPGASHSIYKRPSQLIGKVAAILEWFSRYGPAQEG